MNEVMGLICANYNLDTLGVLTENRPLASMPFGGRYRLIDFVLSNMVNAGIRTVGVITPYMYRSMMDHLGAGKEWCLDRKRGGLFILPGSIYGFRNMTTPFLIKDMLKNRDYLIRDDKEYVIVTTANQIYNMDYEALVESHAASGAEITLVSHTVEPDVFGQGVYLEMTPDKRVPRTVQVQKERKRGALVPPSLFADCFIIRRTLLIDMIGWYQAVDHMDFLDMLGENLSHLNVRAYEFSGYLGRVRSIETYIACSMDVLSPQVHEELFFSQRPILTKIRDGVPTRYLDEADVSNSLIPNECTIRGRVENSIIFPKVTVESGAVIKNSVIMQRGTVGRSAALEHVIADKFVTVGEGTILMGSDTHPLVIRKNSVM